MPHRRSQSAVLKQRLQRLRDRELLLQKTHEHLHKMAKRVGQLLELVTVRERQQGKGRKARPGPRKIAPLLRKRSAPRSPSRADVATNKSKEDAGDRPSSTAECRHSATKNTHEYRRGPARHCLRCRVFNLQLAASRRRLVPRRLSGVRVRRGQALSR